MDECSVPGQGPCHPNAVCQNLDGTVDTGRYRCICPPGMLGDGVSRCDVKDYLTVFEFGIAGTPPASFDEAAVVDSLYTTQVIPASVERSRVNATAGVYRPDMVTRRRLLSAEEDGANATDSRDPVSGFSDNEGGDDGGRRLLWRGKRRQVTQEGTQVKVVIQSDSPEAMENTTAAINTANLDPAYTILAEPSSEVSIIDTAFAPVEVDVAGFAVDSIVYSKVPPPHPQGAMPRTI